jgi:uncharacterized protein (TIGR02118 family)
MVVKRLYKFTAKEGMTREAFADYWLTQVAPLVKQLPGLKKYTIDIVISTQGEDPGCQGFGELWWDNLKAMQDDLTSPLARKAVALMPHFVSKSTTQVIEEHVII